jgi:hypothetical protein
LRIGARGGFGARNRAWPMTESGWLLPMAVLGSRHSSGRPLPHQPLSSTLVIQPLPQDLVYLLPPDGLEAGLRARNQPTAPPGPPRAFRQPWPNDVSSPPNQSTAGWRGISRSGRVTTARNEWRLERRSRAEVPRKPISTRGLTDAISATNRSKTR